MDIENVTITKKATYCSNHALYQLEYTINNNILSWIRATVNEPEADDYGNHIYIGSIHYENNMINCSLPVTSNVSDTERQINQTFKYKLKDTIKKLRARKNVNTCKYMP